jgi:hypothetical protein
MEVLGRGLTKFEVISLTAKRLLAAQKDLLREIGYIVIQAA